MLKSRPGRSSHTFIFECDLEQITEILSKRKKEQKHKVFISPFHLKDACVMKAWAHVEELETVILDLRDHVEKAATRCGKHIRTFKL